MRDKLIELIIDGFHNCTKPHEVCSRLDLEALADYLIAHGVTVETGGDLLPRESVINGVLMQMQASSSPVCMEEFLRNLDGVTLAEDNNVLGKTPLTNADRIRAMTDEELAKLLYDFGYEAYEFALNPAKKPLADTQAGFLHWLKQPAKEDA